MIEHQLECCFEQTLEFGAEYDPYWTLFARPNFGRIALKNCFKPSATVTMNKTELTKRYDSLRIAPIRCPSFLSFTKVTAG
jgi:hypothetical protein